PERRGEPVGRAEPPPATLESPSAEASPKPVKVVYVVHDRTCGNLRLSSLQLDALRTRDHNSIRCVTSRIQEIKEAAMATEGRSVLTVHKPAGTVRVMSFDVRAEELAEKSGIEASAARRILETAIREIPDEALINL